MYNHFTTLLILTLLSPSIALVSPSTVLADKAEKAFQKVCVLADKEIDECSGLAISYTHPGSFWVHNDSGDAPQLYLVGTDGETTAVVKVSEAKAVDWEDMCSFQIDGQSWLLIGDIGDNDRNRGSERPNCRLYLIREPVIPRSNGRPRISADVTATITFRYEEGPWNCEGLAVDTERREILLLTKSMPHKCGLYSMPLDLTTGQQKLTAKRIASTSIPFATGLDISPQGKTMAVVTVLNGVVVTRTSDQSWGDAFRSAGRAIDLPPRKMGETICFDASGNWLYLNSEEAQQPLWKLAVPTAASP